MNILWLHDILLSLIIIFSIFVVISQNPIYSVFCLIMVFLNAATLLFMYNVEYLGIVLLIVYAGAVSVLFLFVIILFNIKNLELNEDLTGFNFYFTIIVLFKVMLTFSFPASLAFTNTNNILIELWNDHLIQLLYQYSAISSDIFIFSYTLYTTHFIYLALSSLILLVAMIGAITITRK